MSETASTEFDVEEGLLALPGSPEQWIWAFTCPEPKCACRSAVLVSVSGGRERVRESGQRVAEAWRGSGHHGVAAAALKDATTFALDLDTLDIFPPVGSDRLDLAEHAEVKAITDRLDDELLDAIARLWYRGKGKAVPRGPGEGGTKIEVEGWRPGDMVLWDDAQPSLRRDTYVISDRIFETVELYCVESDCDCREVIVEFSPILPRGAPHLGHVAIDGVTSTLFPASEHHRERLTELWGAYFRRHPNYAHRFARRCASMHALARRIVAAPPRPKAGRNESCPCGSGKKFKRCCYAT